jgi:hypothetical protein
MRQGTGHRAQGTARRTPSSGTAPARPVSGARGPEPGAQEGRGRGFTLTTSTRFPQGTALDGTKYKDW